MSNFKLTYFAILAVLTLSCTRKTNNQMVEPDTQKAILSLGDSYTKGESVVWEQNFPNQLADSLRKVGIKTDLKIIAQTGWRTDNLIDAIEQANLKDTFDLVTLLIGVNNQYQGRSLNTYKLEFEELLKTAIKVAKNDFRNVIVLSIPDYGFTPFGKDNQSVISNELAQFNEANKTITASYGIDYVDITPITQQGLTNPSLVANDGLHPSALAYEKFVEKLIDKAKNKLGN